MPERLEGGRLQPAAVNETALPESFGLESAFLQHQRRVFRAAFRITGNAQDAEDVLQTVFLRLARQGQGTLAVANPPSYLYRAAVNAALDLLRARRERPTVALEEAQGSPDGSGWRPDQVHEAAELRAWLRRAIAALPPRAAVVFALRHLEGHENKEIARALGMSRVAVAVTLHRARHRLRQEFRAMKRSKP
jgi:RNA polymerase sigma-70 factor, ECF subfamily